MQQCFRRRISIKQKTGRGGIQHVPGIGRVNGRERKRGRKKKAEEKEETKALWKKTKTVIKNMLDRGYEIEDICAIAGCEASFVEEMRKELHLQ